jgi:putative ABC transport system ATP-binding protein
VATSTLTLVHLDRVSKTYGAGDAAVHALRDIDLAVDQGAFVVILGPSGSGKTTILNLIGGMDTPSTGRVIVEGVDIATYGDAALTAYRREKVGFIFQFFNLIPTLTARENVELAAELVRRPRDIDEVLEAVGLGDRARHFPGELSGGEQQRVAIARAVAGAPSLILADEPTAALDSETGQSVMELLSDIARRENRAVLAVTHDQRTLPFADRIVRIEDGLIVGQKRQRPKLSLTGGVSNRKIRAHA